MYTLDVVWPIRDGCNEIAELVQSGDLMELARIASNADFRAWARNEGCAFIEIWDGFDKLIHFERP